MGDTPAPAPPSVGQAPPPDDLEAPGFKSGHEGLRGKSVLVVGASTGIGRVTAQMLVAAGARVAVAARRVALLAPSEMLEGGRGSEAGALLPLEVDVRDELAVKAMVERCWEQLSGLDAVVYSAGWNVRERTLDVMNSSSWHEIVDINLTGAYHVTQSVVPYFEQQGAGLIVYIGTVATLRADRSGVAYQASKAGLAAFARATMQECRDSGIRTTVIFPGMTDTPFLEHRQQPTDPSVLAHALQPEDVASACLFALGLPERAHVEQIVLTPARG